MSPTFLAPSVPPVRRLITVAVALLLVAVTLWLSTALLEQLAARVAGPSLDISASADHALPRQGALLLCVGATLTVVALLLAWAQRSRNDLALAGAAALWTLHIGVGAQALMGAAPAWQGAPVFGLQLVTLGAVALSLWYGLHLLRRTRLAPHPIPLARVLGVAGLLAFGTSLGWDVPRPVEGVLPLACLLAWFAGLVRAVDMARRPGSPLRPSLAAWLLAVAVALAAAASSRELWLHLLQPAWDDTRWAAWCMTRWAVLGVVACALGLRLDQLARTLRQLVRSHRLWRGHLHEAQQLLQQTRERLALRERGEAQRQQRDRILRELHDELGHRLMAALTLAQQPADGGRLPRLIDTSLLELRLAYDALEPAPRPLAEAAQALRLQLEPLLDEAGVAWHWRVDPRAATLVLSGPETLQLLRIVRETVGAALDGSLDMARDVSPMPACSVLLDVPDGETGRHLRLRIQASGAPGTGVAGLGEGLGAAWVKLQRQATSLGAQLALDPGADGQGWSLELVLPLDGR